MSEKKTRFTEIAAELTAESIVLFYHLKKVIALAVKLYNEAYPEDSVTIPFRERRRIVIDLLNEYVDMPWVPEWAEDKLIGVLIDEALRIIETRPKITSEELAEELYDE